MLDMADDHAAYAEAMQRAEQAAGITRDAAGNEVYAEVETPVVTPELEGAVPIQASDQPLTPEPVVEETPPETSEQQQEAPEPAEEDPRIELARLQARLEEKDSFIGRQSSEVGELRQAIADLQQQVATTPVDPTPAATIQITQELIDNNPALATQEAFRQGNRDVLPIAFEAWKDEDPFAAASWRADQLIAQQRAESQASLEKMRKELEATTAPLAQSAKEMEDGQAWKEAFDEVKATRPDFLENAERLLTEVAPQFPSFLPALQTGDARAKADALSALYALDKMGNPQAVQAQLAEAAEAAAAEAAAARAGAGVVNGQTTAGQPSVEKTEEESEQESYISRMRSKPSLAKGWTGRS